MKISVIDCAIVEPVYECYNQLVSFVETPLFYHLPSQLGMRSLERCPSDIYIVLGSYSNVDEHLPWHKPLADFLMKALHLGKPVLGICFGHQLLCHHFGAKVQARAGDPFYGVREITALPSLSALGLIEEKKFSLLASHGQEVTDLPECLNLIATSKDCQVEAVEHKTLPFIGIQAHPEASWRFVETNLHPQNCFPDDEQIEIAQTHGLKMIDQFIEKGRQIPRKHF